MTESCSCHVLSLQSMPALRLMFSCFLQAVVASSTFSQNHAGSGGGLLTLNQANLSLQNSSFMHNEAVTSGGAVYLDSRSVAVVHGCAYTGNRAGESGGGVLCTGCLLTTTSTAFTNNSASAFGGGLYVIGDAQVCPFTVAKQKACCMA